MRADHKRANLGAGLAGATVLTLAHESTRRLISNPPRMDRVGERAVARALRAVGVKPPKEPALHRVALAFDLVTNSLYYAFVGVGRAPRPLLRGVALGALAGAGAVLLPAPLRLGPAPRRQPLRTHALTFALYLLGGLSAGLLRSALARRAR